MGILNLKVNFVNLEVNHKRFTRDLQEKHLVSQWLLSFYFL